MDERVQEDSSMAGDCSSCSSNSKTLGRESVRVRESKSKLRLWLMLSTAVGEKEPPRQRGRVLSHTTQILEKKSGAAAPPREFSRLNAYISYHTSQTKLQKKP